jgi:acyl carrier protein
MAHPTAEVVRQAILSVLGGTLSMGPEPTQVPDSFNILSEGVVDSFGFIELLAALEQRFDMSIDLTGLEPEVLGRIGVLAQHIAKGATRR